MRKLIFATFLAAILVAGLALRLAASGQQPAVSEIPAVLAPLAWMVGGTWVGEEKGANNSTLLVYVTCRWSDTRQAILFDVAFESGGKRTAQYDGMFIWHPGRNALTLWQVNRKGEVAEGEIVPVGAGALDSLVRVAHREGGKHFLKTHYKQLDKDTFHFKAFFRVSEEAPWMDAVDVTYRRR